MKYLNSSKLLLVSLSEDIDVKDIDKINCSSFSEMMPFDSIIASFEEESLVLNVFIFYTQLV